MMQITHKNSLEKAFLEGINLFVGAGFSILANDIDGRRLPCGNELRDELAEKFNKARCFTLPQLSAIIQAKSAIAFDEYLTRRFSVASYDDIYNNITGINLRSVYTTNIDNLIPLIIANTGLKYTNNQIINGPSTDKKAINYMPLHGYVEMTPHKYIFDTAALANVHNNDPRIWGYLAREVETYPTLFLGYGFNDVSVIQTIMSQETFANARKEMWILLRKEDIDYQEYYETIGFNVIVGDIHDFLEYVGDFKGVKKKKQVKDERLDILSPYLVPRSIQEVKVQRPIKDFFIGSSPIWSDIINNLIYKTHHYSQIIDVINKPNKNVIIIGAPVSGKSTLLMQIAYHLDNVGVKLFFEVLTKERAEFICKLLKGTQAIVFIDNLTDSIDTLPILEQAGIQIVAAERSHNFGIISHLVNEERYEIINVTQLSSVDLHGIYNSLPTSLRTEYMQQESELSLYGKDSVFEFVIRNVVYPNIRDRYIKAIKDLEDSDSILAEFVVLCAYMHSCRIPLSYDMAYDYFSEAFEGVGYQDIFDLKSDACDIVKDYIPLYNAEKYSDMDYYYPRSRYGAEIIINSCSPEILKRILWGVIKYIPTYKICNYSIFRKYAFDKTIINRAFSSWEEGLSFYEEVFMYDSKNPYVLQQGALYLAQKEQYANAFIWIDRAISMTDDTYFSIRNSHAIILFNANYAKKSEDARLQLDRSMHILEKCIGADKRKKFHACTYGKQAKSYYEKYQDEEALAYLKQARDWLQNEIQHNTWDVEVSKLHGDICSIIKSL